MNVQPNTKNTIEIIIKHRQVHTLNKCLKIDQVSLNVKIINLLDLKKGKRDIKTNFYHFLSRFEQSGINIYKLLP